MKYYFNILFLVLFHIIPLQCVATSSVSMAHEVENDSVYSSISTYPQQKKKKTLFQKVYKIIKDFSRIDTNYIEEQKYNFTIMLQNTNTYEHYQLQSENGYSIEFAPNPSYKLGPYIGWRWIFLGYTIDLKHIGSGSNRQDFNLSLYSNQIGIDLFYRKSGDNYKIKNIKGVSDTDLTPMKNIDFDGFKSSIKGFNLYYITNHKKFSYPAAYSQSTIQRKSAGSPLFGIGYTKHSIDIDWTKFHQLAEEKLGKELVDMKADSALRSGKINYNDYSLTGGYAYNWVFAKNWLLDVSLSLGIAYKHTVSDMDKGGLSFRNFDLKNFNIDGVSRVGIVWNNMRWYYGLSAIFHTYNYKKRYFRTNTKFGNVNIYIGYNFGKR